MRLRRLEEEEEEEEEEEPTLEHLNRPMLQVASDSPCTPTMCLEYRRGCTGWTWKWCWQRTRCKPQMCISRARALSHSLSLSQAACCAAREILEDVGVARLVLESARNDICEEMASVYSTDVERQSKEQELEEALVDRQTSKTALEHELRNLQSLLADSMQNEKAREHQMSDVLGDLQQASCKIFVLENANKELEQEVSTLRTRMDAVTCNAKKV